MLTIKSAKDWLELSILDCMYFPNEDIRQRFLEALKNGELNMADLDDMEEFLTENYHFHNRQEMNCYFQIVYAVLQTFKDNLEENENDEID